MAGSTHLGIPMPCFFLRPLVSTLLAPLLMGQDAPPAASAVTPTMAAAVQTLPDAAYGLILIPDLFRLSQHSALISAIVHRSAGTRPTLVGLLGGMLGDPGLSNLAPTPIIGVVVPGVPAPCIAFIIPCVKPQAYLDALAQFNMTGQAVGTLVVVSNNPGAIQPGVAIAASYQSLIATPDPSDLRVVISPKRLAAAYGGFVKNLALMMAASAKGMGQVLNAEISGFLAVSADIDAVQADLSWSGSALAFDQTLTARPGSALAKALIALPRDGAPSAATRLDSRPAFVAVAGRFNSPALGAYANTLAATLSADPAFTGLIGPDILDGITKLFKAETGTIALQLSATKTFPFTVTEAFGTNDPKALEAIERSLMAQFSASALMHASGMTFTFDTGVRSVGTMPVDRFTTVYPAAMNTNGMPTQPPMEMAFTDRYVLISQDAASLDAMILGTNHGMTLQATKEFPAGMDGYGDVDPCFLAPALTTINAGFVPPAGLSHARCTLSWMVADSQSHVHVHIPAGSISDFATIFASMKAQHVQPGNAPARAQPASAPTPTF